MIFDSDRFWQAIEADDPRFDGWVFCGVKTTGIYCRPSCPARTPKRENVRFFATAAAAQAAGFRACKRCRPDATPGSPDWDLRADLVGRAMRLIADGVVDREGVGGLAARLGYTERHVHRQLVAVVGAGPLALARAQRAQTARILLETTDVPITGVAFAAGFQSVRQFNATIREIFAMTPRELRARAQARTIARRSSGALVAAAALPGAAGRRRPDRVPRAARGARRRGGARRRLPAQPAPAARRRRRRAAPAGRARAGALLAGGPARPGRGDAALARAARPRLRPAQPWSRRSATTRCSERSCTRAPGRRVPGHVDGHELAVRAVLGQQVSLRGAATLAGRLVGDYGEPLERPLGGGDAAVPLRRGACRGGSDAAGDARRAGRARCSASPRRSPAESLRSTRAPIASRHARALLALPGIGPWTAEYIAMRALRDPDAFLPSDLGVRHALERLGQDGRPAAAERLAERWRPYRAYAVQHLWASLGAVRPAKPNSATRREQTGRLAA